MKSFIRNLTPRGEAVLVFLICFVLGVIGLIVARHLMPGSPQYGHFSNLGLMEVGIYELSVFTLVFLYIGRIRGWSIATFGFQVTWKWTGLGVLLFIAAELVFVLGGIIVSHLQPSGGRAAAEASGLLAGQMALPIIIINSIINGIFEELMEAGYVIKVTAKYGMWSAVFASGLLRTVLHIQLGAAGMVCVLVIGATFALVYWKLRQLWPLVVAHILMDVIGFLYLAHHAA